MTTELWDILNDPLTTHNVSRMFRIGTEDLHESAFAVYSAIGGYSVSKLLVPSITHTDLADSITLSQHLSIDVKELTHTPVDQATELRYEEAIHQAQTDSFSSKTKAAINRIKWDDELLEFEKEELIEGVIRRELKISRPTPTERDDLLVVAHNHPILPFARWPLKKLLVPSNDDVEISQSSFIHNPNMFEAIIASDTQKQGMLLYAPDKNAEQQPHLYNVNKVATCDDAMVKLRQLGYRALVVALAEDGHPLAEEQQKVEDFMAPPGE